MLINLIQENKSIIVDNWFSEIASNFPSETIPFLKKKNKQFSNPMGYNLFQGVESIVDYLTGQKTIDEASSALEEMIKIIAVQNWSAEQSLSFMYDIKKVFINLLGGHIEKQGLLGDWINLESEIDYLTLKAFDLFMQTRERLYDIRANQMRNRTFRLLQQANLLSEEPSAYSLSENCSCL